LLYSTLISFKDLSLLFTTTMNPFNLQQNFHAELTLLHQLLPEPQEIIELNYNTVFDDFLNETDTANEDTITHIIHLDIFNNPIDEHIDEHDDLLQFILDFDLDFDFDDVITYDSPMEAEALFAD